MNEDLQATRTVIDMKDLSASHREQRLHSYCCELSGLLSVVSPLLYTVKMIHVYTTLGRWPGCMHDARAACYWFARMRGLRCGL